MSEQNSTQPINNAAELQQRYAAKERNFSKANLAEADLSLTNLSGADLQGANLRKANLSGANLESTMLHKANLQGANLRGASLSGALLIEASLERADLTFADFSDTAMIAQGGSGGANLSGANLSGANLKKANLKGAYYDGNTQLPAGFDPVSLGMQKLRTSSKKSSSSNRSSKPILSTFTCFAIVLSPVVIVQTWAEVNKSETTPIAKDKPETKVSFEANPPAAKPEIEVREASTPSPASTKEANLPAAKPETEVKEASIPSPAPTPDVKRKTQPDPAIKPAGVTPIPKAQVASCPALVRLINAASPDKPSAVDVSVNGKKVISNVPFSQASRYVSVSPGKLRVQIMKAGTRTMVDERTFAATPNSAYSVAVTGSLLGSSGQSLFNKSPFVIPEDLSPPKPGKFKGGWYKLSETKAETDLRITKSGAPNVTQARLVGVIPKTAVDYPELKAGTYNFNTVLPNKSDPLVNNAYKPPIRVEIAKAKIPAGTVFDVFAIGNTLGKGHNSLKLSAASYRTLPPTADGCTKIQ